MSTIDELACRLSEARIAEANAREARIAAEEAIIAQLDLGEAERRTISTDVGLKLTVQSGLSYKLDKSFDETVVPVKVTTKTELDAKAYEALREANPAAFGQASKYVTVTPKKTSVTLAVK